MRFNQIACSRGYKQGVREGMSPRSWHRVCKVNMGGSVLLFSYECLCGCMTCYLFVVPEWDPSPSFYSSQGEVVDTCYGAMVLIRGGR